MPDITLYVSHFRICPTSFWSCFIYFTPTSRFVKMFAPFQFVVHVVGLVYAYLTTTTTTATKWIA